jgi:hypothetical protein
MAKRRVIFHGEISNLEEREELHADEDVDLFCGEEGGTVFQQCWIKCQTCGNVYHELCVGAEAVRKWKMSMIGIAPGDPSYPTFLMLLQIRHF